MSERDADDRCATLSLSEQELRDLAQALDHRLAALADARTYRGHALRADVHATSERVVDLAARIGMELKRLAKLPGGSGAKPTSLPECLSRAAKALKEP